MKRATEKTIREISALLVREVRPAKVILFGSWAKGRPRPDSDVDLMVVEEGAFGPRRSRRKEMTRLWSLLSGFEVPLDILVYSLEEFDYWSGSLNHVVGRAVREGRTLYERP